MQVSEALALGKTQPELDFVDIDLDTDTPLFLDPGALHQGKGAFAEACSKDLDEFFEAVLHAAGTEDWDLGLDLLAGLREPDEIQLGFSKGPPRGRGVGDRQAEQIFEAILRSKAIQSGLIQDLKDTFMFVPGIGPDKVSDITTNIIRRHLIEYTQNQFLLHGKEIDSVMPTGLLWDSVNVTWTQGYENIPVIEGRKILLVPKWYVKYVKDFTRLTRQYYDGFIANFIRDRELATMGKLVSFRERKSGPPVPHVYKDDIEKEVPRTKDSVAEFSIQHPEVYDRFKQALFKHNPVSVNAIMAVQGGDFRETEFSKRTIEALEALPPGARHAADYQSLMVGILHYLFYPSLTNPVLERAINSGRKRIDIAFENTAESGVFSRLRQDPFLVAREVMIECKNYSHDLENPEIDQLLGRFDHRRGRFGIMMCRKIEKAGLLQERCADAFRAQQGAIVVLTDQDVIDALNAGSLGRETRINERIQNQLRAAWS